MYAPVPLPLELTHRPFTVADAQKHGVTIDRTRARDLERPFHGVRAPIGSIQTLAERCRAYATRMPSGQFFSHMTAALLLDIPLPRRYEADLRLHVSAPHPTRATRAQSTCGHSSRRGSEVREHNGLPVLAPAAVWCQLAPFLYLDELIAAGDRLLGRPVPLATGDEVHAAITAYGPGRGALLLRRALAQIRDNVESPRETRLRLILVRAGLPEPEANGEISIRHGTKTTHGDLVFRRYRVLTEYDGEHHRLDGRQFAIDVTRLNDLAIERWTVVRIDKHTSDADAVRQTRDALLARGWTP